MVVVVVLVVVAYRPGNRQLALRLPTSQLQAGTLGHLIVAELSIDHLSLPLSLSLCWFVGAPLSLLLI